MIDVLSEVLSSRLRREGFRPFVGIRQKFNGKINRNPIYELVSYPYPDGDKVMAVIRIQPGNPHSIIHMNLLSPWGLWETNFELIGLDIDGLK